jgi:zinc protease
MRRRLGSVLVLCLVAAACTSSGGDSAAPDSDDAEAGQQADDEPAGSDDGSLGESSSSPADSSPNRGDTAVALPGLLDNSNEKLTNDASVRVGVLDNGLRYYIRNNDNPGGKANLRLAIKAGSVDEFGASAGVAHFVEHMLFNGTEKFPENELIDVLRSFGAAFGADINAYTSFDETVYELTVPNEDQSLQAGMNVLEQWLSHTTFDPDQVIAERGIVLDEWRVRTQSVDGRLFEVAERMYLDGTPYQDRSPIGSEQSISDMTDTELREYYDTWYRPENAAIIVVGEIDVDDVEDDIVRLFGPAAPRADQRVAIDAEFDLATSPAYGLHADPDQRTVDVEVTLPLPAFDDPGTAAWRLQLIDIIVSSALVRRLDQDISAGVAPFDRIGPGTNSFVDALDAPALYAVTDAEGVDATLQALLDEYERASRFGFSAEEVEIAKSSMRANYDTFYAGRDSAQDVHYADEYVDHFLTGSAYPSIADEYEVSIGLLEAITAEAVDLRFRARWTNSAPHVIISSPESAAGEMPTENDVLTWIGELARREISPRGAQRELPDALMQRPDQVSPLSIDDVLDSGDRLFDPIEIVYPNGARVYLNTNTIAEGRVFFQAGSPGGSSLVPDDDVVDALYAADIVTSGGVADFNQAELEQIVAGSDVELGAWITPYLENFGGSAATVDLEVLMQLLHLYMTEPRFDPVALDQLRNQVGPVVEDPSTSPGIASADALLDARYPGELRYASLPTPEQFATLDLDGVERVWNSRYGNAADWVFVFSGDFDLDTVTDLAGAYLATLPGSEPEQWIDVAGPPPPGVVRATAEAGTGDTASLTLLFTSPVRDVDARLRVNADVVTELVDARLTDVIREQNGDSYSPFAVSYITTDPDPTIETYVSVTGSPDRIEAVADLVVAELADLGTNGPSEQEFFNAYAQVEEAYNFVNNGEFITELLDDAIHPALDIDEYLLESAALVSVSASTVRTYLADHVPPDQYIQVIVVPR